MAGIVLFASCLILVGGSGLGPYMDALPLALNSSATGVYTSQGPITIFEDGQPQHLFIAADNAELITSSADGLSFTMRWGGGTRAFVVKQRMDTMPVENYVDFNLLGRAVSFDVDLSRVGCSCNAALFFTSMPGFNADGSIAIGNMPDPYYCDANKIGGVWCWEHDTMEANMFAFQTTPHRCSQPPFGPVMACDRIGCGTNIKDMPGVIGPGPQNKIDTTKQFSVTQNFHTSFSPLKLVRIENILTQGANVVQFDVCADPNYLMAMTQSLGRMKMVFQLWGDSYNRVAWLDGGRCSGACDKSGVFTVANIKVDRLTSGAKPKEHVVTV